MIEIRGRVVDDQNRPVARAVVADFWRANGTGKNRDGKPLDLKIQENVRTFWGHLGEMEPVGSRAATAGADGKFTLVIPASRHAVMAMDRDRRQGGLLVVPKGREREPVEIRLGPLVKIRGSLRGPAAGEKPTWSHVYACLPEDVTRPLDATRLVSCGSHEARFEMSLPPGRYLIRGYNETYAHLVPDREIDLPVGKSEVDLGVLMLSDKGSRERVKIDQAKSDGRWVDVADRYGKPAPRWYIPDARGIPRGAQVGDFRSKWLLVYFWGFGCAPCLETGLPSLVKFHEQHAKDRDRFEIVAFCIDGDAEVTSMDTLDRKLEPVIRHVWNGKTLPFPVALDASFRTLESFGVSTFGPYLISPDGILMKGDETVLGEKLKQR